MDDQFSKEEETTSVQRRLGTVGLSLLGIGIFYVISLAGTFAGVWLNAAHKTEATLDYAASDLRDTADEVVDAVLANVGVAIVGHLKSARPATVVEMRQMAKDYNVDEICVVNRQGIIIGSNDPTAMGLDMTAFSGTTAEFMVLTNGTTDVFSQKFRRSESDHSVVRKYLGIAFPGGDGYVQVGYDERRLAGLFRKTFGGLLSKWRIGETGFYICADKAYSLVAVPVPGHAEALGQNLMDIGMTLFDIPKSENKTFVQTIFGKRCYCRHFVYARHRMYSIVPAEEFYGPAMRSAMIAAAVLLIVFFVFGYIIGHMVSQNRRIAELRALEDARRSEDLKMAKTIQLSALPVAFPNEPDYRIFAKMKTAREVGGDFYDFNALPGGKVLFLVADVSGKGIPAALFMMRAKAILRSTALEHLDDLSEAVRIANESLSDHNEAEMFVTAWIGIFDRATGEISCVNAGHNPPLIKRADGSVEWVRSRGGLALAAMRGVPYQKHVCRLGPGDSIFLYTDGVTEAMNADGELYGENRLETMLKQTSRRFVTEVEGAVSSFADGTVQSDDITMLALDRLSVAS